jgi:hypothetical protein
MTGIKEAQLKALREQQSTKVSASPKTQPKETVMATKTKAKGKAKGKAVKKPTGAAKLARVDKKTAPVRAGTKAPAVAAAKPPTSPTGGRRQYPWADAAEKAKAGTVPPPLDFTAACNAPYRARLAEMEKMAKAKDLAGLKAFEIPDYNSIVKAMRRWRDLAVMALSA